MPTTTAPVLHAIDRWETSGLVEPATAERLRDEVANHTESAESQPAERQPASATSDGSDLVERAVSAGLEALGYLGAALVIGALGYLADVASWPRLGIQALLAAIAAVAAWTVVRLTPTDDGATVRLVTVVGTAGLFSLAGLTATIIDAICPSAECGGSGERFLFFGGVIVATVAAIWLYTRERNAVTHAWVGMGTAGSIVTLLALPFATQYTRTQDVLTALALLVAALAWTWASETERLRPGWIGTFGAAMVAIGATVVLSDFDLGLFGPSDNTATSVALAGLGGAYLTVGAVRELWRLSTIGGLVLVWSVPWLFTEALGLSATTTAYVLLPVGLALVGWTARRVLQD